MGSSGTLICAGETFGFLFSSKKWTKGIVAWGVLFRGTTLGRESVKAPDTVMYVLLGHLKGGL